MVRRDKLGATYVHAKAKPHQDSRLRADVRLDDQQQAYFPGTDKASIRSLVYWEDAARMPFDRSKFLSLSQHDSKTKLQQDPGISRKSISELI
jgi:hypothetical protein